MLPSETELLFPTVFSPTDWLNYKERNVAIQSKAPKPKAGWGGELSAHRTAAKQSLLSDLRSPEPWLSQLPLEDLGPGREANCWNSGSGQQTTKYNPHICSPSASTNKKLFRPVYSVEMARSLIIIKAINWTWRNVLLVGVLQFNVTLSQRCLASPPGIDMKRNH